MEGLARIVRLHTTLKNRRGPISAQALQEQLECSRPTLFRTLSHLRDRLGAPIVNEYGVGYRYDRTQGEFELPGLWLNAEELHALLSMDQLLERIEPGILREYVTPFRSRIEQILGAAGGTRSRNEFGLRQRVRILAQHARTVDAVRFATIATATLQRKRVCLQYQARSTNRTRMREVSPLRLVHYRDNWYLDAFCHAADGLRTFSIDRVRAATPLDTPAHEVADAESDATFAAAYGIFAGEPRHKARLLFSAERARWVSEESWHPEQHGQFRTDGSYELTIPYADERELLGDVLRHGAHVQVLRPKSLRERAQQALRDALARYE